MEVVSIPPRTKLQIVLLTETNYFLSTNRGASFHVIMYQVVPKVQGIPSKINASEDARGLSKDDNS